MNRGDAAAFDVLYDRHGAFVKGVCVQFLRSTEESEEILQDIFLGLWGGRIRYRPEQARLRTWLFCVAKNRCLDRLKSRSRRLSSNSVPTNLVDPAAPDPEADALASQDRARVRRALCALPVEQRQAIETCFFRCPTYREAAEFLAIPFGTLKSRVRLGLRKLAAALGEKDDTR